MSIPYVAFPIVNYRTGVDLGLDPWLIPQDAFQSIQDAYQYLGVINKRYGYQWFDAFPSAITGLAYQNVSAITTTIDAEVTTVGNHGLSTGNVIRLTGVGGIDPGSDGVPINGTRWTITKIDNTHFTLNNSVAFTGSYSSSTGTVSKFVGNAIMAIAVWVDSTNTQWLFVLDTRRAAVYDPSQSCLVPIGNADIFSGNNKQPFWWENYFGYIFFTNNKDNIYYWTGDPTNATNLSNGLTQFKPNYSVAGTGVGADIVNRCLMIKAFNNRLLLLNTNENSSSLTQESTRIRYSQALTDPTATTSWDQITPGFGGFDDLTDSLYIITMGQIQTNNLIYSQNQRFGVLYEQRPTSDPQKPFAYVKIATSRNVNSTFATVVLDREIQTAGNSGLTLADGNTMARYDDKIPDFAIDVMSQNNFDSAFGIRNDLKWQSWMAFQSNSSQSGVNDQILVFSYQDRSWQIYNIPLATLGQYQYPGTSPTWASYGTTLPAKTWEQFGTDTWISIVQQQSTMLLGGGYDGNIWWMNQGGADAAGNILYGGSSPSGYTPEGNPITMTLTSRQWFPFIKEEKAAEFGYVDFLINGDPSTVVLVTFNVDNESSNYKQTSFSCVPFENLDYASITYATNANPCVVTAPDHGMITGQIGFIFAVQGMTELNGLSVTVTVVDANTLSLNGVNSTSFGTYQNGGIIATQTITQSTFWTRVWAGQTGVFHQMTLSQTGINENFSLHASVVYMKPTGRTYKG